MVRMVTCSDSNREWCMSTLRLSLRTAQDSWKEKTFKQRLPFGRTLRVLRFTTSVKRNSSSITQRTASPLFCFYVSAAKIERLGRERASVLPILKFSAVIVNTHTCSQSSRKQENVLCPLCCFKGQFTMLKSVFIQPRIWSSSMHLSQPHPRSWKRMANDQSMRCRHGSEISRIFQSKAWIGYKVEHHVRSCRSG